MLSGDFAEQHWVGELSVMVPSEQIQLHPKMKETVQRKILCPPAL